MTFLRAVDQCLGPLEPCDPLCSEVGSSKVGPPYHTLLSEVLRNLPSIQSTYLNQFSAVLTEKAVIKSRWVWSVCVMGVACFVGWVWSLTAVGDRNAIFLFVRLGNFSPVRLGMQLVSSFPLLLLPCCPEIGCFSLWSASIPRHCKGMLLLE